jgi:hypothetical protein
MAELSATVGLLSLVLPGLCMAWLLFIPTACSRQPDEYRARGWWACLEDDGLCDDCYQVKTGLQHVEREPRHHVLRSFRINPARVFLGRPETAICTDRYTGGSAHD